MTERRSVAALAKGHAMCYQANGILREREAEEERRQREQEAYDRELDIVNQAIGLAQYNGKQYFKLDFSPNRRLYEELSTYYDVGSSLEGGLAYKYPFTLKSDTPV